MSTPLTPGLCKSEKGSSVLSTHRLVPKLGYRRTGVRTTLFLLVSPEKFQG